MPGQPISTKNLKAPLRRFFYTAAYRRIQVCQPLWSIARISLQLKKTIIQPGLAADIVRLLYKQLNRHYERLILTDKDFIVLIMNTLYVFGD